jgi:anti-anti-sigma factor
MCEIKIDAAQDADAYVISVGGELDLSGCFNLALALGEAEGSQADQILLDIEDLTFIDSSGLEIVLWASRRSARNGDRLRITRGSGNVADMFRLTALDVTLPFVEAPTAIAQQKRGDSWPT